MTGKSEAAGVSRERMWPGVASGVSALGFGPRDRVTRTGSIGDARDAVIVDSRIDSDHLLVIGTIDQRLLILVDIEQLLTGAEMGWVEAALH